MEQSSFPNNSSINIFHLSIFSKNKKQGLLYFIARTSEFWVLQVYISPVSLPLSSKTYKIQDFSSNLVLKCG